MTHPRFPRRVGRGRYGLHSWRRAVEPTARTRSRPRGAAEPGRTLRRTSPGRTKRPAIPRRMRGPTRVSSCSFWPRNRRGRPAPRSPSRLHPNRKAWHPHLTGRTARRRHPTTPPSLVPGRTHGPRRKSTRFPHRVPLFKLRIRRLRSAPAPPVPRRPGGFRQGHRSALPALLRRTHRRCPAAARPGRLSVGRTSKVESTGVLGTGPPTSRRDRLWRLRGYRTSLKPTAQCPRRPHHRQTHPPGSETNRPGRRCAWPDRRRRIRRAHVATFPARTPICASRGIAGCSAAREGT